VLALKRIKIRWVVLSVIIITIGSVVTVILLQDRTPKAVFTACVILNEENRFLVYKDSGDESDRLCYVTTKNVPIKGPDNQSIPIESIKPKQMVKVTFGGLILLAWPSSYQTVYEIKALNSTSEELYNEGNEDRKRFNSFLPSSESKSGSAS
jgi:hypothetical protein